MEQEYYNYLIRDIENISQNIDSILLSKRKLNSLDSEWLALLDKHFGIYTSANIRGASINDGDDYINGLATIASSLRAILYSSTHFAIRKPFREKVLHVNNNEIAQLLMEKYESDTFGKLFKFCLEKGVFYYGVDKDTGFIKTTLIDDEQNWEMSRQWITDTVRTNYFNVYFKQYALYKNCLDNVCLFYNSETERDILEQIIKGEKDYNDENSSDFLMTGVAHIFCGPKNKRDPNWFNNKRLESHGIFLNSLCENIINGLEHNLPQGYIIDEINNCHLDTIILLSHYFKVIEYPKAYSSGNWEEKAFKNGLTWDTTIICESLCKLHRLMFHNLGTSSLNIFTEMIKNREIEVLSSLNISKRDLLFDREENLLRLIGDGINRVRKTYLKEAPHQREIDASLIFITHSSMKLDDDILADVDKHVEILQLIEKKLLRENGIIRYAPFFISTANNDEVLSSDSYLNLNYNLCIDKSCCIDIQRYNSLKMFGSKDCSDSEKMIERDTFSSSGMEAHWFFVSDISKGYGVQIEKLINLLKIISDKPLVHKINMRIHELLIKQTEFINRAYARITENTPVVKADGNICRQYSVPEAYQYVSTVNKEEKNMIPGIHTPLSWAQISLLEASVMYEKVLKLIERAE